MEEETCKYEITVDSLINNTASPKSHDDDNSSEDETVCSLKTSTSNKYIFSDDAVMLLITHYKRLYPQVGETIKSKTCMWKQIAALMEKENYSFSPNQVENKFKALKRGYLNRLTKSLSTGKRVRSFPFDKDFIEALHTEKKIKLYDDHDYDDRTYAEETKNGDFLENNSTVFLFNCPSGIEEETCTITKPTEYNIIAQEGENTEVEFFQELNKINSEDDADTEAISTCAVSQMEKGCWVTSATNLLVKLAREYLPKLRVSFKTKRCIWKHIAKEMRLRGYCYTDAQVENKFKTLKRRFRTKRKKNVLGEKNVSIFHKRGKLTTQTSSRNNIKNIDPPITRSSAKTSITGKTKLKNTTPSTNKTIHKKPTINKIRSSENKSSMQGKSGVVFLRNTNKSENDDEDPLPTFGKCLTGEKKYTENEMFEQKIKLKKQQIAAFEKLSEKLDITNSILHNIMLALQKK